MPTPPPAVNVPVRVAEERVLLVNVSVPVSVANVLVVAGKVNVVVPAAAVARSVVVPDVDPEKIADVPNDKVVSIVADPYILVPLRSFAIVFYLS